MDPKQLREEINKLGTEMRAITEKAAEEKRDLTADEDARWEKLDTDREALLKKEHRALRMAEIDAPTERRAQASQPDTRGGRMTGEREVAVERDVMNGFRGWLLAGASAVEMPQEYRDSAKRAGIRLDSKRINLRMAPRALRSGRPDDVKTWEERALSTLTATSPEDGSYLIANEMIRPLERALLDFGGVREVATVIRTTTGAALPFPTSDDTSNKGALLAENTQTVEKDTEFGQMVLNAYKFSSKKVLVSIELLQDSATDIASFLGTALGERIGRITADYFTTGSGSSQPNGIVTAATSAGVALAAQTPTYAEMVSIQHSVDPAYRKNGAAWMFHDTVLAEVKKIVDASTGRPIWLPNMIGGAPDTILGNPYTVNQSMAVAAGSGSGKSILYGQLSKYYVRDVMDIQLMRLDELYAEYGQVAFLAFSRSDGDLLDAGTHPVKYATNHS